MSQFGFLDKIKITFSDINPLEKRFEVIIVQVEAILLFIISNYFRIIFIKMKRCCNIYFQENHHNSTKIVCLNTTLPSTTILNLLKQKIIIYINQPQCKSSQNLEPYFFVLVPTFTCINKAKGRIKYKQVLKSFENELKKKI